MRKIFSPPTRKWICFAKSQKKLLSIYREKSCAPPIKQHLFVAIDKKYFFTQNRYTTKIFNCAIQNKIAGNGYDDWDDTGAGFDLLREGMSWTMFNFKYPPLKAPASEGGYSDIQHGNWGGREADWEIRYEISGWLKAFSKEGSTKSVKSDIISYRTHSSAG